MPGPFESDFLEMKFNGRIIDHLGIQMYQSPTAAIAEIIANAWDADATEVRIDLPDSITDLSTISIQDSGCGMQFAECQQRFLNVGYCRRKSPTDVSKNGRPILGRKGIGKFAGFGIARVIEVDTTSEETGERTVFELDVNALRSDEYVGAGRKIDARKLSPSADGRRSHGTRITLKHLFLKRTIPSEQFRRSMARRFLLLNWASGFQVYVKDLPLPQDEDLTPIEYVFPAAYPADLRPIGLRVEDGWGVETLPKIGKEIRWRVRFFKEPIDDEELQGIAVFAKVKLAQQPFFFNLSGGLGGQVGQQYMTGTVKADYLDEFGDDIIATERQRINWEHEQTLPLLEWGQTRIKDLLRIWRDLRGEAKQRALDEKISEFSKRLENLLPHERKTVKAALRRLAAIPSLTTAQFQDLAQGVLKAWEQGRLRELIHKLSERSDVEANDFLDLLIEADVLTALNLAEAVRTKLEAIQSLQTLIEKGELENAVRNFIADRPYLLHPKWETYKVETSVRHILDSAVREALIVTDEKFESKRIDLALRSGNSLLVIEFMRPGVIADWDHLTRSRLYMNLVREKIAIETALGIDPELVTGLVVADRLADRPEVRREIQELKKSGITASTWKMLLAESNRSWREFLAIIGDRAPKDDRIKALRV